MTRARRHIIRSLATAALPYGHARIVSDMPITLNAVRRFLRKRAALAACDRQTEAMGFTDDWIRRNHLIELMRNLDYVYTDET